jgi:hypothetical protein
MFARKVSCGLQYGGFMETAAFLNGMGLGGGLIVAIGSQNAY